MEITDIRHDWPEKAGFTLVRPTGIEIYTFLHFMNSVEIEINREKVTVRPGACIFYAPDEPQWFHSDSNLTHNWAHFAPGFRVQLLRYRIPENTLLYPRAVEFISGLFRKTEAAFFSNEPFREDLLEAYTTEFLVRFSRAIAKRCRTCVTRCFPIRKSTGLCRKWHRLRLSALRTCMRYTARFLVHRPCAT